MKNLQQSVALVTGGSRGIGAAIARRLALDGTNIAITYQSSREQAEQVVHRIRQLGVKALAIQADSADPQAVREAVEKTVQNLGGLNILVNNAGIGQYKPVTDFTVEDFDNIVAINVRAVFVSSLAAARYLNAGDRIITIGSCQADRMPVPNGSLYAMSKSALIGLTKGMARDFGSKGITVNLVQPGPVDTDMNPADGPFADFQRSLMAIQKFGTPDDIASLVAYLASADAGYITGTQFTIDGGTNI